MAAFTKKILESNQKREPLFGITNAYRVVNGATDGFPGVTIDRFGNRFQVQFFDTNMLYEKVKLVESIADAFPSECIVIKERLSSSGKSLENAPMEVALGSRDLAVGTVFEGCAKFHVDLLDTINPGLFLDMRHVRLDVGKRFREMSSMNSRELRFLNLFSYTCSFSVHARLGGASIATNADISGKILNKGRENYALNGIDLRLGEFFRGNALEYVRWALKKGIRFDGIVLDPPSFARFKGFNFNVREHLFPLVAECAGILNPGAFFMVSSNYSEFSLPFFAADVRRAVASIHPSVKTEWAYSQDVDFNGSGFTKDTCLVATMVRI